MKYTFLAIERTIKDHNVSNYKLEDGKIIIKKSKNKLKDVEKLSVTLERTLTKDTNKYIIEVQAILNVSTVVDKYGTDNVNILANKNTMYISGKDATEELAKKIAKEFGGEYTKRDNPFFKSNYYRINFYDDIGLWVDEKKFNKIKENKNCLT